MYHSVLANHYEMLTHSKQNITLDAGSVSIGIFSVIYSCRGYRGKIVLMQAGFIGFLGALANVEMHVDTL